MEITRIKETCIYVKDVEVTRDFYEKILNLPVISLVPGRHTFFKVNDGVLLCFNPEVTKAEKKLPPHFAFGKQHLAFEVPLQDYENWKRNLTEKGIVITHEETWKNNLPSFYFEDPDGHVLEIVVPGIWP